MRFLCIPGATIISFVNNMTGGQAGGWFTGEERMNISAGVNVQLLLFP